MHSSASSFQSPGHDVHGDSSADPHACGLANQRRRGPGSIDVEALLGAACCHRGCRMSRCIGIATTSNRRVRTHSSLSRVQQRRGCDEGLLHRLVHPRRPTPSTGSSSDQRPVLGFGADRIDHQRPRDVSGDAVRAGRHPVPLQRQHPAFPGGVPGSFRTQASQNETSPRRQTPRVARRLGTPLEPSEAVIRLLLNQSEVMLGARAWVIESIGRQARDREVTER
jgi:hypothetical protein